MIKLVLAAFLAFVCSASAQAPAGLFGNWIVTTVVTAGPVTAMSGSAVAHLVGRVLTLTPHGLRFAGQTCRPDYESSKESLADISQDYKIDAKMLKLPDPVLSLDADCTEIFIRAPGTVVFTWNGYFLEATKSSRTARHQ